MEQAPIESANGAELGGWGITIARKMSDELTYTRVGGKNVLSATFARK